MSRSARHSCRLIHVFTVPTMITDKTSAITGFASYSSGTFTTYGMLVEFFAHFVRTCTCRDILKASTVKRNADNLRHGMASALMARVGASIGTVSATDDIALCRKSCTVACLDGRCHALVLSWEQKSGESCFKAN
jgi:hypothetical protein